MKLIMAIVNNDDSSMVQKELTKSGFAATKLATTGGFLSSGNTTYIVGVDDIDVERVMSIFSRFSKKRNAPVSVPTEYGSVGMPTEVSVGGATVFVLNVERFEKL
ncbi:MAG: transcriptional regulator [Ruminococcaceae bacterium]|nr:transcriptional regulator [Oscillospiraceae bacterium]